MNNSLTNVNKDLKKEEVRKLLKTKDFGKWTKKVKERAWQNRVFSIRSDQDEETNNN